MTLDELKFIRDYVAYESLINRDTKRILFILNREINLKTTDFRKPKEVDNLGNEMSED